MKTHGYKYTRLYNVWGLMKNRCFCKTSDNYKNYGNRGIKVCDEWKNDFVAFRKWSYENGYDENAVKGKCTLDRIDNGGNYEPSNCRWVDNYTQANNTRINHQIEYDGEIYNISQWSNILNISRQVIEQRMKRNLPIDKVLYKGYLRHEKIIPIIQYDLNGNFIKEWNMSARAIGKNSDFCYRNILYCCNKKQKQHKEYIWRYKNDNEY